MKIKEFELIICSPVSNEKLTCEIYYKSELLAELSQETDVLLLEIYSFSKGKMWVLPLGEFQEVLERAKKHLFGEYKKNNLI